MNRYSVYGACLESEVDFPELPLADGVATKWRFTVVPSLPPVRDSVELGSERIYGHVHARLLRHAGGHRIVVDDTGTFDLDLRHREVRWEQRNESWPDFVRAHCIGRVLATSMYLDGWLPLHGSAVATAEGVIAFLAPKGFGKSSLALALTTAGARLVTDDTLPVEITPDGCVAWPGVHSVRLNEDAIHALGVETPSLETRDHKLVVGPLGRQEIMLRPEPLRAIYLLDPVLPAPGRRAARGRLSEMMSAVGVVGHTKIGRMLGPAAAPEMLDRAARIVREVPAYRLETARDLALLPAVAQDILSWHGAPA
jgi:hypothetical protein